MPDCYDPNYTRLLSVTDDKLLSLRSMSQTAKMRNIRSLQRSISLYFPQFSAGLRINRHPVSSKFGLGPFLNIFVVKIEISESALRAVNLKPRTPPPSMCNFRI